MTQTVETTAKHSVAYRAGYRRQGRTASLPHPKNVIGKCFLKVDSVFAEVTHAGRLQRPCKPPTAYTVFGRLFQKAGCSDPRAFGSLTAAAVNM